MGRSKSITKCSNERVITRRRVIGDPGPKYSGFRNAQNAKCPLCYSIERGRVIAIRAEPWPRYPADSPLADLGIRCSKAHSGSHASSGNPAQGPRIAPIGMPDLAEHPFRDSHAFRGWGTTPAPPFGIRVAGDSTVVPVFRPSCSPISNYVACAFGDASGLLGFCREVVVHPSPKPLFKSFRTGVPKPLADLIPIVALPQHLENLPYLGAVVLSDASFDEIE